MVKHKPSLGLISIAIPLIIFTLSSWVFSFNFSKSIYSIQEAIDAAKAGDKVIIEPGNYMECVVINKSIHLVGEGPNTVIDGCGRGESLTILSDGVVLESITIRNSGGNYSGIYVNRASNVLIVNCVVTSCHVGIKIDFSNDVYISNCEIANNTFAAIRVWGNSKNINVQNCTIHNNRFLGVGLLTYSQHNNLIANNVYNNSIGVALINSEGNQIVKNRIHDNRYGLYLEDRLTKNNTVVRNWIFNNTQGVYLNIFSHEQTGNLFCFNNFISNTIQAYIEPPFFPHNDWNLTYPLGGNYWSDHSAEDLKSGPYQNVTGSDGFADKPYYIAQNNIDFYPLSSPYKEHVDHESKGSGFDVQIAVAIAVAIIIVVYSISYLVIKRRTVKTRNHRSGTLVYKGCLE
jgi:parallel beta-helix repeat protein